MTDSKYPVKKDLQRTLKQLVAKYPFPEDCGHKWEIDYVFSWVSVKSLSKRKHLYYVSLLNFDTQKRGSVYKAYEGNKGAIVEFGDDIEGAMQCMHTMALLGEFG